MHSLNGFFLNKHVLLLLHLFENILQFTILKISQTIFFLRKGKHSLVTNNNI